MRAARLLPVLALLALAGCDSRKSFSVKSDPPGAQVTVDGVPAGVTPTTVLLDPAVEEHTLMLKRPGYASYEQKVHTKPQIEGPTQRCAIVACSPCCAFLPLATLWEHNFIPKAIDTQLDREGQGLEIVCRPVGAQILVDGILAAQTEAVREESVEGNVRVRVPADYGIAVVPLEPKVVKVEIRAEGCQSQEMQVMIQPGEYVHLTIDLLPKPAPTP